MIYTITFDPHKVDADALYSVINSSPYISTWWHYLGSTYLIKSEYSTSTICDYIIQKWPKQRFFIAKIDPYQYSGWLPPKAWEWIRNHR